MKLKIGLLVLSIILNSCYSYRRPADLNEDLVLDRRYKVKTFGDSNKRGKLTSQNDSIIVLKRGLGKLAKIYISDVKEIRQGKFSYVKTIAYPLVSVVVLFGIMIGIAWQLDVGAINFNWQ